MDDLGGFYHPYFWFNTHIQCVTHVHCTLYQVLGHLGANDDACRRAIRARRDDLSGASAPVRAAAAFVLQEEC